MDSWFRLVFDLNGEEPDIKDAVLHRMLRLPVLGTSALNVFTSRTALTHHLRREVFADPAKVHDATVDSYYRTSHLPGAHSTLAAYLAGYLNHNVRALLPRIEQPLFIAWGRDAMSPAVESADLWLRDQPTARLEVFANSALQPHAENPEEFVRVLLEFLETLRT